jgi:predicted phage terminase large subunit-like protein
MALDLRLTSPAGFARYASSGTWQAARHLVLLNRILLAAAAGESWASRVIIQMPPRHGKSEFVSGYFPAWYLGLHPDRKVILTSFSDELAQGWGQRNRDHLQDHGGLFGVRVRQDTAAKGRWSLARRRGTMTSTGMGGTLTGRGGHLIIIDDPVKNDAEALSPTYRARAQSWYKATLRTRLEQPGAIVVIQTRWHQDDLAGWLQAESDEDWLVISLPAIAEADEAIYLPDDPDRPAWTRKRGEALWPERIPLADLEATRDALGGPEGHWWLALYQQRPTAIGGGVIKPEQFRRYRRVPDGYLLDAPAGPRLVSGTAIQRFGIMDLATSVRTQADWTVLGVFGLDGPDLLLLDVIRNRWEGPDLPRVAHRVWEAYRLAYLGVESVGFQQSTVQDMRRGDPHARPPRPPLPVRALQPNGDKISRALTFAAIVGGGHFYVPESAPWLDALVSEVAQFPRGAHDDQVDVLSYAGLERAGWADATVRGA